MNDDGDPMVQIGERPFGDACRHGAILGRHAHDKRAWICTITGAVRATAVLPAQAAQLVYEADALRARADGRLGVTLKTEKRILACPSDRDVGWLGDHLYSRCCFLIAGTPAALARTDRFR